MAYLNLWVACRVLRNLVDDTIAFKEGTVWMKIE